MLFVVLDFIFDLDYMCIRNTILISIFMTFKDKYSKDKNFHGIYITCTYGLDCMECSCASKCSGYSSL